MTWQKYILNLRNSLLLEDYFRVMEQFDSTLSSANSVMRYTRKKEVERLSCGFEVNTAFC